MSDIRKEAPAPLQRPERKTGLKLFLMAAVGLVVCSLLVSLSFGPGLLMRDMDAAMMQLVYDLLYYGPFVVLPILLCIRRKPQILDALRPNPMPRFASISIISMALICVFLVNDITLLWAIPFQKLGFNVNAATLPLPRDTAGMMISVISIAVIPGICEEFLFRGMVLSSLEEQGTKRAVMVSALLFAMIHGSLIGAPGQFLLGMLLALLVIYTDSIYAGLTFHTVYNACVLILQFLQERSSEAPMDEDYFTAIGGTLGVMELLFSIGLSLLLIWLMLRVMRMRARLVGVPVHQDAPVKMNRKEKILLIAGIAMCVLLYGADIAAML